MTKFIFETGEVIEVTDKAIVEVLRADKRYKELKDNEEVQEIAPVNELQKEVETLKTNNGKVQE